MNFSVRPPAAARVVLRRGVRVAVRHGVLSVRSTSHTVDLREVASSAVTSACHATAQLLERII